MSLTQQATKLQWQLILLLVVLLALIWANAAFPQIPPRRLSPAIVWNEVAHTVYLVKPDTISWVCTPHETGTGCKTTQDVASWLLRQGEDLR